MKKNSNRMNRINDEITKEIANIIRSELKDPRVGSVVSVLRSDTSTDLKQCRVYVSILGDGKAREETMEAIVNASGFMRRRVAELINLRFTPELLFISDDSMERGFAMSKLIDDVIRRDAGNADNG